MDISVWQNGAMQQDVGRAIRSYRKARGWTTEQLAKASEIDKGTVNRVELGGNAQIDTLLRIARALDLQLEVAFRAASGESLAIHDRPSPATSPVSHSGEPAGAPREEVAVLPSSFPSSPVHLTLYGYIGDLDEELARQLRRPLLDLIERIQGTDQEPTEPSQKKRPK